MKLNKKTMLIGAAVIVVLIVLFIFGGPGIRTFLTDIFKSVTGIETNVTDTPSEPTDKPADPTNKPADPTNKPADPTKKPTETAKSTPTPTNAPKYVEYKFRTQKLLNDHFEKHGKPEMGFKSASDYEKAASDVINNPKALHKTEKEDGDTCYYIEETNEFVVLSKDGYIRTYFLPSAGKAYYDRQ